jgi:hypothetical protein
MAIPTITLDNLNVEILNIEEKSGGGWMIKVRKKGDSSTALQSIGAHTKKGNASVYGERFNYEVHK